MHIYRRNPKNGGKPQQSHFSHNMHFYSNNAQASTDRPAFLREKCIARKQKIRILPRLCRPREAKCMHFTDEGEQRKKTCHFQVSKEPAFLRQINAQRQAGRHLGEATWRPFVCILLMKTSSETRLRMKIRQIVCIFTTDRRAWRSPWGAICAPKWPFT